MSSTNFNLRDIPAEIMTLLKKEAKGLRISVNSLVLQMIERGLGFKREKLIYHDLDHLAGSWTAEDEKEFKKNIQPFEQNIIFNESDRI
jgi:hypothetical protein